MMMPANFSAIAENELTYVVGGGIEEYLAPVMTAANWQTFNKNLITIVGNTYMTAFVNAVLTPVFKGGNYTPGNVTKGILGTLGTIWMNNVGEDPSFTGLRQYAKGALNVGLQIVGGMAAVYTLGNGNAKISIKNSL